MNKKIVLIIFIFLYSFTYSKEKIRLAQLDTPLSSISIEILKIAYERINVEIEFVALPASRALHEANRGVLYDSEVHRIKGISKKYKNLIMIPVPINHFELRAYSKKFDFYINSKKDLEAYLIGIRLGIVIAENYTRGLNVETVINNLANFGKLDRGRLDFVIATDINADTIIKNENFKQIKKLEPALSKTELYHYLHKSKAHLIPRLTEVLRKMQQSGEISEIRERILREQ